MTSEKQLIDANDLKNVVTADINRMYALRIDGVGPLSRFLDQIDQQPTIDAVEVVHGRWDKYEDDKFIGYDANGRIKYRKVYTYYCGRCGRGTAVKTNYCPNCGAKMDGDGNE